MNKVFLASAVAAAFAIAAPFAGAQSSEVVAQVRERLAAAPTAGSPDASATPRAAPERRVMRGATERVEARLAYIRTALKITDAQSPQWENFANVLRKHAQTRDQRMKERKAQGPQGGAQRGDFHKASAIDRLERTQQRMAQRSAQLSEVITAAKPLYATLSTEQKQVADGMLARQGGRHGGRGGHPRQHHRGMHRGA